MHSVTIFFSVFFHESASPPTSTGTRDIFQVYVQKSLFSRYGRIRPHGANRGACRFHTDTSIYCRVSLTNVSQKYIFFLHRLFLDTNWNIWIPNMYGYGFTCINKLNKNIENAVKKRYTSMDCWVFFTIIRQKLVLQV